MRRWGRAIIIDLHLIIMPRDTINFMGEIFRERAGMVLCLRVNNYVKPHVLLWDLQTWRSKHEKNARPVLVMQHCDR
jgi:hypothetical protein